MRLLACLSCIYFRFHLSRHFSETQNWSITRAIMRYGRCGQWAPYTACGAVLAHRIAQQNPRPVAQRCIASMKDVERRKERRGPEGRFGFDARPWWLARSSKSARQLSFFIPISSSATFRLALDVQAGGIGPIARISHTRGSQ